MLSHMILHRSMNASKQKDDLQLTSNARDGQVRDPVKLAVRKQSLSN